GGASVSLTATGGTGNTLTPASGTTDPTTGVLTATFSSTTTGGKTISATINSVAITQTAPVTVTAGAVSATTSTVEAAPASIPAGSGTSTITVTARDAGGNVVGGASVVLTAGGAGNTLTPPSGTTDPTTGVLTATFSATGAGERTVSATINSVAITQTAPVTVTAGAASQIAAQGQISWTAMVGTAVSPQPSVIVSDEFGNPVALVGVRFDVTGGGGTANPITTSSNASGIATTSWTLGLLPGDNTLTATATGLTGSPVTFTATGTVGPPSSTQSRVTAEPAAIPASAGSSVSTLTVTALDAVGNPVPGATVTLDASGVGNTLTQQAATTDASGRVTGTLSSTGAEMKTV